MLVDEDFALEENPPVKSIFTFSALLLLDSWDFCLQSQFFSNAKHLSTKHT